LMDRACLVSRANGGMLRHKVGAGVVAVRRAGAMHAFDALNHFFLISEMIVPGSSYWNIGIGHEPGDVEKDEEGIRTMKVVVEIREPRRASSSRSTSRSDSDKPGRGVPVLPRPPCVVPKSSQSTHRTRDRGSDHAVNGGGSAGAQNDKNGSQGYPSHIHRLHSTSWLEEWYST